MPSTSKHSLKLIVSILSITPALAYAASPGYICHHGDRSREIVVQYDVDGQSVPCGVLYRKGEGEQELWRANDEAGYCEARAREFAAKQESWGWQCSELAPNVANDETSSPAEELEETDMGSADNADVPEAQDDTSSDMTESEYEQDTSLESSETENDAANLL
ncbi:MAG: hypothetical protein K6L80_02975 [Agarilytica sp.]